MDSVFAWKERFKQQEYQTQTLQSRVSELKNQIDQLTEQSQKQALENETYQLELSKTKQELLEHTKIAQERQDRLTELENSMETAAMSKLRRQNEELSRELDNLQGQMLRGAGEEIAVRLATTLTPLMLREFDPQNSRYENAFVQLVEAVIDEGDTFQKIIGTLIKYGGSGPISQLENAINNPEFPVALEMLVEEKILKVVEDHIMIASSGELVVPKEKWAEMELSDVFDMLKKIMENEADSEVLKSLDLFRDTLQERELPAAKIFFEIRKMSEGIKKKTISRKETFKQIDSWWTRLQAV